ncbi:Alpha/Beta hydrolase protein [Biscogniauxia mediterranea]|nr:Alpha/Beta hydrolase protein [Biscogniauxia mediterranea]
MSSQPDVYTSSPTWADMLENGAAKGLPVTFDKSVPLPWQKNRQDRANAEEAWSKANPPSKFGYERVEQKVAMRDGAEISVMVYRPQNSAGKRLPLMFVTHGGGWYQGSHVIEEIFQMRAVMKHFQIVIVAPNFRLSPEHPFPGGLNDCWDTFLWTLRNDDALSFDRKNIILAASSGGGALAAVLGIRAGNAAAGDDLGSEEVRQAGFGSKTVVKGVFLNVPGLCHPDFLPKEYPATSYAEAHSGTTVFTGEEMYLIWKLYEDPANPKCGADPDMSPLLADLRNFPPARIYVAGQDPLRDEALAFGKKLKESSRDVEVYFYPGVPHVFAMFDDLKETAVFWDDVGKGLGSLLK